MGGCFSKKKGSSSSSQSLHQPQQQQQPGLAKAAATATAVAAAPVYVYSAPPLHHAKDSSNISNSQHTLQPRSCTVDPKPKVAEQEQVKQGSHSHGQEQEEDQSLVQKKEIFVIKHRKSHDRDRGRSPPPPPPQAENNEYSSSSISAEEGICNVNNAATTTAAAPVRTSSCTKEEVDAILIQCGRLSRSNSFGKATSSASRKYSGSKRSYDFGNENDNDLVGVASISDYNSIKKESDGLVDDDCPPHRRQSRSRRSPSHSRERRRTPSRERDQRSTSRQRDNSNSSGGGGRRVSRSPGRRSDTTPGRSNGANVNANATSSSARPGKMVSVPATVSVSTLAMDGVGGVEAANGNGNAIKRISVKRNVGGGEVGVGSRGSASPRSQSPARGSSNPNPNANNGGKGCNEAQQQQPSLSRNNSRKAERSPYRRNPLSEIDPNSLAYPQSVPNRSKGQEINQKLNVEMSNKAASCTGNGKVDKRPVTVNVNNNSRAKEQVEETIKTQIPQTLTRSTSSKRSWELDLNPEALSNNQAPPSYTTLLLEDIQNFHQANNPPPPSFSLPPCVSKACSILEAVADLNSTTSSNISSALFDDSKGPSTEESSKNRYNVNVGRKLVAATRDPFVESEVVVAGSDDLMEPSFHKYVTVRRGGALGLGGADMEEQESSGSNSFVGGSGQQQHWGLSSSSWEPNSAESTDRWTSSSAKRRVQDVNTSGSSLLQRQVMAESEPVGDNKNRSRR